MGLFRTAPLALKRRCGSACVVLGSLAAIGALLAFGATTPDAGPAGEPPPPAPIGHPSFLSPHFRPIACHPSLGLVFVANTPADTVDVLDSHSQEIIKRIPVGVDPVGLAIRPDGLELWVSNHISDSVSVIDTDPASPAYLHVVATIQDVDLQKQATQFDEPVGLAFASNKKAYVALSSENKIAIIDVQARQVTGHLEIPAQDPRGIVVRGRKLYVIPFESHNQTQLSGGSEIDGDLVTFDARKHSLVENNVLSVGHVVDLVKHPDVPDRDLFVFDTETDKLLETVDSLGTLLYGLAVDSKGSAFIAQTDARNHVNGRAGSQKHGLAELQNRPYLNQITRVDFEASKPPRTTFIDLEPRPSEQLLPTHPLATPFAIEVTPDDRLLVATAAGSNKLFTVEAATGKRLGEVMVSHVPRGLALDAGEAGAPPRAWVLNAVDNSVSLVDLSDPSLPVLVKTIALQDPTPAPFKKGRKIFNSAAASASQTFSCASCHPDGHVDQLLWVLKTPIVSGGDQIQPRTTMPVRGLRETLPFHWDGIPGDPYGGNNSATVHGDLPPNVDYEDPIYAIRHLIDDALATTMALPGNEVRRGDLLDRNERYYMSHFLLGIPYPPAQRRAYTNVLSPKAEEGFELFHLKGHDEGGPEPNVCGNCHRMPFGVSTNTPGSGMDAPTWRGAYDRFLIFPQGRLNIIDFDFYREIAEQGFPERDIWRLSWQRKARFDPVWDMVLESSTGFSGSFARQLTLNAETWDDPLTRDLLPALEASALEGAIVLQVDALFPDKRAATSLQFQNGAYLVEHGGRRPYSRDDLRELARQGRLIATITARHGADEGFTNPQPALWTLGPLAAQVGPQEFPVLTPTRKAMTLHARHLTSEAHVIVDGRRVQADLTRGEEETITITFPSLPSAGLHFLQVQNAQGLFSNDFLFFVDGEATAKVR